MLKDTAGPGIRRGEEEGGKGGGALVKIVRPIDLIVTGIATEVDIHQLGGGHRRIIIGLRDIEIIRAQDPGVCLYV